MKIFGTEGRSIPKHTMHEAADGIRINPGPYIGTVKNTIDPLRSGRLQVFIDEFGGDEDDSSSWRTLSYCSPFFGHTDPKRRGSTEKGAKQSFDESPHSYGMWFVPPDVGVKVLCTFVNGDPYKGFWFGCIPEWPSHHMVPGMANSKWRDDGKDEPLVDHGFDRKDFEKFYTKQDVAHTTQTDIYKKQGLISEGKADPYRGPGISTSFRETPSRVFGISTPGPELKESDIKVSEEDGGPSVKARKGGHMFIMDDGTAEEKPKNQMIKLRTSTGHTIVMNDSIGCIYIINAEGTAWFEMDDSGNIKAYSKNVVEMHSDKGFKFETLKSFQITAESFDLSVSGPIKMTGNAIDLSAERDFKIGAGQDLNPNTTGRLHLTGDGILLNAKEATSIYSGTRLDLESKMITFNSVTTEKAQTPIKATKCVGPTKEPYKGHQNVKGPGTTGAAPGGGSPFGSAGGSPFGAAVGSPFGSAGAYGSGNGFGEGI